MNTTDYRAAAEGGKTPTEAWCADFGEWVRTRRKELNLSQAECALRAGIDQPAWGRIERGRGGLTIRTVLAVLKAVDAEIYTRFRSLP